MSSMPRNLEVFVRFDQLLEAARNGSREAQGRLLETCRLPLLRLARRVLTPDVQAKGGASDLVQDTFLKALREIGGFEGCTPEQLLAWLRVILLHNLSNFARQFYTRKRLVARETPADAKTIREDPRHAAPSAGDAALHREQARLLKQILERLPDHYGQVIRLRNGEGRSFEEIGRLTGRSADAARKLWLRAIGEMGRELERDP